MSWHSCQFDWKCDSGAACARSSVANGGLVGRATGLGEVIRQVHGREEELPKEARGD